MRRKSLLFLLLFALLAPWAANAQTLTVCDGTVTNQYIPLYGYYADTEGCNSEFIIPATELTAMNGKSISAMSFYLSSPASSAWGATFQVYMKEVSGTTLDDLNGPDGCTTVYTGELDGTGTTMDITFDEEYLYQGGNLLIGTYVTSSGSWESAYFYGIQATGAAYVDDASWTSGVQDFLPKTTFTYSAPAACAKPTNLAFTLTPGNGTIADLSWTENGEATAWQICLNGDETNLIAATTNPWRLTGLTPETTYTAKVRANCGSEQSNWSNEVTFTPTNAYSITVNDGTSTNSNVPYYAYYHDSPQRSEFIIPASSLEDMTWGTITSMKFYPNYTYTTSASIQVYLMEVEATTFSDVTFYTEDDATVVYNGTLTISPNGLIINLNGDGFEYNGGNLLVGFYQATGGSGYYNSSSCPFYGVIAEGASIEYYYSTDYVAQKNFLPKTTFEYTPGEQPTCFKPSGLEVGHITATSATATWTPGANETQWQICLNDDETNLILVDDNFYTLTNLTPDTDYTVKVRAYCGADDQSSWTANVPFTTEIACPAPTNVAVSDITATSATVSWTGEASGYNLRYRELTAEDFATITFAPNDVWQDGTGYQLLLDADATAYGTIIPENGGLTTSGNASAATYAEFEYKIPVNADGAMNTQNVLIGTSATIQVPAGTFDWCVTNPTPGDRIWIAGEGRANDYVFEGGKTYLFVVQSNGDGGDEVVVTVTEPGSAKDVVWTEINNAISPCTISVNPEKDYIVEVQANCGADGTSAWVSTNFSTPSNCQVPTPLDVTDITASTATLNWTGLQDRYQVQYRTKGSRELLFFESFDSQPSTWTLTNAAYERTSSQTTDYFVYLGYNSTETAYLITPDLTGIVSVGTVEFYHRCYNGDATFQVGFSSTTNDVDAFTWGEEVSAAGVFFTAYEVAMPAGTKYVAVKSTTSATDNYVFINDFGIYGNEIPAGQWNTATANTTSCPISGLTANTEYEWQVRGVNESCGGYTEWCDLVTFTTEVSCPVPTDVTVSDVTGESAVIAWTSDASLFDIDVNGVVTNDVTNPYTLENLEPETIYTVKVRANCGDGDYSDWTESIAFVTDCGGAKDVPYTYGFEDLGEYYACWGTYADADNENSLGISSYDGAYDGSNVFVFSSYTNYGTDYDQYLFSPDLNASGEVTLEFYYRTPSGYGSGETFEVGYTIDGEEFIWGEEISTTTTEWTLYSDVLPAGTQYVVIHYYSDYQYYLLVDGFSITAAPVIGQTIELAAGWNWFSTYIDMDPVELLEMFEEGLGEDAIQIKSKTKATAWDEDEEEWSGGLQTTGLTNDLTYMVQLPANTTLTVTLVGPAVATESCTINLQPGWNWIGFPSAVELDVNEALANFEAMNGDQLKTRNQATAWDEDEEEWSGSLNTLVPGQGLMFYSAATDEVRTLVFNAGSSKGKAATQNGNSNLLNHTKMVKNNTVSRIISMNNTKMETKMEKNELQKFQDNYKRSNNPL